MTLSAIGRRNTRHHCSYCTARTRRLFCSDSCRQLLEAELFLIVWHHPKKAIS